MAVRNNVRRTDASNTIAEGVPYYSTIFVRNQAGIIIPWSTDWFKVDLYPPICAQLFDGSGYDIDFFGTGRLAGGVPVSWIVGDAASGVV